MTTPKSDFVCIQGIPVPTGKSPGLRTEVSTWAGVLPETSIQVSLFIRALQKFYDVPYKEKLSFFQVAGMQRVPLGFTFVHFHSRIGTL